MAGMEVLDSVHVCELWRRTFVKPGLDFCYLHLLGPACVYMLANLHLVQHRFHNSSLFLVLSSYLPKSSSNEPVCMRSPNQAILLFLSMKQYITNTPTDHHNRVILR